MGRLEEIKARIQAKKLAAAKVNAKEYKKMQSMPMKEVYSFLSDEISNWADSDTYEWQKSDNDRMCTVYIFDNYISIEDDRGHEIYNADYNSKKTAAAELEDYIVEKIYTEQDFVPLARSLSQLADQINSIRHRNGKVYPQARVLPDGKSIKVQFHKKFLDQGLDFVKEAEELLSVKHKEDVDKRFENFKIWPDDESKIKTEKTSAQKIKVDDNKKEEITSEMVKYLDKNKDRPGKEVAAEFEKKFKTKLSSKILNEWNKAKKENKSDKKDASKKIISRNGFEMSQQESNGRYFVVSVDGDKYSPYWNVYYNPATKTVDFEGSNISGESFNLEDQYGIDPDSDIYEILSELYDLLLEQKADSKIDASKKVKADVDAQGTPEVGDAPANDKIDAKPPKAEEAEDLNKDVDTENKSVVGDAPEAIEPEKVIETQTMPEVKLGNDMSSSVAIVKLQEQLNTLKEESAINDAVIKEVTKILSDSGIKVAALRRVLAVSRVTANEKEKALKVIAMAEKLYNDEIDQAVLPMTANKDDVRRHAEMKSIFAQKLEIAGDSLEKVAKGEIEDEKSAITAIYKDIRHEVREWEIFKKIMATHDRVADTVNVIQGLLDAKAIHAEAMAMEFDSYYNMETVERKKVSASVKNAVAKAEESFSPLSGEGVMFPGMSAAAKHKSEIDGNSLSELWDSAETKVKV